MRSAASTLVLDPLRVFSLELPELESPVRRGTLRMLLALSAGSVRVEGVERLAAAPEPSIFALSHHNAWEAVLAPAALVALRRGRLVRFLVDWMFVDLPWTGWLVRQIEPIPVYGKPARFRLREEHRARRLAGLSPVELAVAALDAGDDVGIYPEGRRSAEPHHLLRGRLGLGLVALRSGAPVVPVGIDFDARDRLRRTPRLGRFALSVGEPLSFDDERAEWLAATAGLARRRIEGRLARGVVDRVSAELARRSRKLYLPPARSTVAPARPSGEPRSRKVVDVGARADALAVLADVYGSEKGWLTSVEIEIPADPAADPRQSWFVAHVAGEPAGTLRLAYDPPLALPAEAEVVLEPGVELEALARTGRFVEIGRLTVRLRFRGRPAVILALLREAIAEVERRGYTHLLTAVFEDDPHSPLGFHTRVLGFERIGTHRRGELRCASRRILLVLDLERARERVRRRGGGVLARLLADTPPPAAPSETAATVAAS